MEVRCVSSARTLRAARIFSPLSCLDFVLLLPEGEEPIPKYVIFVMTYRLKAG